MSLLVRYSCRAYAALLALYPPDLRRRFGSEMADTFAQQVLDAWERRRLSGLIGVWTLALPEFVSIALPRQVLRPGLAIPVASLIGASAIFISLVWALQHPLMLTAWYHHVFGGLRR
jgi:hypothetical protein